MLELANFRLAQFSGCFGLVFPSSIPSSSPQRAFFRGRKRERKKKREHFGFQNSPILKGNPWIFFLISFEGNLGVPLRIFFELEHVEFCPKKSWHRFDTSFFGSPSLPPPHSPIYTLWKEVEKIVGKKEREKEGENYLRFHTYKDDDDDTCHIWRQISFLFCVFWESGVCSRF